MPSAGPHYKQLCKHHGHRIELALDRVSADEPEVLDLRIRISPRTVVARRFLADISELEAAAGELLRTTTREGHQ